MNRIESDHAVSYDDVLLVPQYSTIESRKNIDIGSDLDENMRLNLPIISSPMDTVTEGEMAETIYKAGGLGIVHRYNTIQEQGAIVSHLSKNNVTVGAAIGISGDYLERAQNLIWSGAKILCLDVAHGHHILMERALNTLRDLYAETIHLMAGNVATLEAFNDLVDWGANSVRCNIGGGSICSTRIQTGHGVPGLQTILDCSVSDRKGKIIADGGIKTSGDIVKALAAGADLVMLGSLLAGTDQSPGEIFHSDKQSYKIYRGMASKEAQVDWKGTTNSLEGISTTIPYKGNVKNILASLKTGIRSGFSYSGARTIEELHSKSKFIKQSSAGQIESSTHILNRK